MVIDSDVIAIIVGLVGLVLGALVGGGSVLVVMARLVNQAKSDPAAIRAGELLFESIPSEVARAMLSDLVAYLVPVTDGVAIEDETETDPDSIENDKG